MSLTSAINDGVKEGLRRGMENAAPSLVDTVLRATWTHPWYPFLAGAQLRLIETGMEPVKAWHLARKVLTQFVADEKVAFGDSGYDWSQRGGRTVIEECEIEYWDDRS